MEDLSAARIQAALTTRQMGREILFLSRTSSTNDEARRLAEKGAPEGTVVIADFQSNGRGRHQRRWQAPPGSSLLLSVVLRPAVPPEQVQRVTMMAGLAVADAIEASTGITALLKWPNDILAGSRKVGGILTEVSLERGHVEHAVVGIGLNVNLDPSLLAGELIMPATSLSAVLGHEIPRLSLLLALLCALEERCSDLLLGGTLAEEWAERLVTLGRPVTVALPDGVLHGVAEGVDASGALLVRNPDGQSVRVVAGDVVHRF